MAVDPDEVPTPPGMLRPVVVGADPLLVGMSSGSGVDPPSVGVCVAGVAGGAAVSVGTAVDAGPDPAGMSFAAVLFDEPCAPVSIGLKSPRSTGAITEPALDGEEPLPGPVEGPA